MSKRKSKNKISDKMIGVIIGMAITLSAIGIISAASVSFGNTNFRSYAANDMEGESMMAGDMMSMMHSMMMGDTMMDNKDMMKCVSMMNNSGEMTQEEMEEMMQQMDKDGDGLCDYCGMSLEACRRMMSS